MMLQEVFQLGRAEIKESLCRPTGTADPDTTGIIVQ